jgi:hypothetical protein
MVTDWRKKPRLTAVGTCCADHATPLYPQKSRHYFADSGGRSVGIVRLRTKATEFSLEFNRLKKYTVHTVTADQNSGARRDSR